MNETNKSYSNNFSINTDSVGIDNQVKVNLTFKVALTEQMQEALQGADNGVKAERKLNTLLGPELEKVGRESNHNFRGKFCVTGVSDVIEGVYHSESMVYASVEAGMVDILKEKLTYLSGDKGARAYINMECSL